MLAFLKRTRPTAPTSPVPVAQKRGGAPQGVPVPPHLEQRLRELVRTRGERATLQSLHLGRTVVTRLLSGLTVREGSIALLEQRLSALDRAERRRQLDRERLAAVEHAAEQLPPPAPPARDSPRRLFAEVEGAIALHENRTDNDAPIPLSADLTFDLDTIEERLEVLSTLCEARAEEGLPTARLRAQLGSFDARLADLRERDE